MFSYNAPLTDPDIKHHPSNSASIAQDGVMPKFCSPNMRTLGGSSNKKLPSRAAD